MCDAFADGFGDERYLAVWREMGRRDSLAFLSRSALHQNRSSIISVFVAIACVLVVCSPCCTIPSSLFHPPCNYLEIIEKVERQFGRNEMSTSDESMTFITCLESIGTNNNDAAAALEASDIPLSQESEVQSPERPLMTQAPAQSYSEEDDDDDDDEFHSLGPHHGQASVQDNHMTPASTNPSIHSQQTPGTCKSVASTPMTSESDAQPAPPTAGLIHMFGATTTTTTTTTTATTASWQVVPRVNNRIPVNRIHHRSKAMAFSW